LQALEVTFQVNQGAVSWCEYKSKFPLPPEKIKRIFEEACWYAISKGKKTCKNDSHAIKKRGKTA
jgi:hypothetical protein